MYDETDPPGLLRLCTSNFNTAPDRLAITRINDSLNTLNMSRDLRITDQENALRALSRQLSALTSEHNEIVSSHDTERHAQEIVDLDTKKFRVAKGCSELEVENERLEAELDRLKSRLGELDREGVEGGEGRKRERSGDDPTVLRLWLYRSLGISLEQDEAGNYNKATINNTKKGDVHVVNIDPKFSKGFYADYFWQTMKG